MGRRKAAPRRVVDYEEDGSESPLFDDDKRIDHIAVERLDPPEGFLGTIDPSSTEEDIRGKYGGGKFRLRARDVGSHYVKGVPVGNATIGGEPIFQSISFERQWKRRQGIVDDKPPAAGGALSEKPLSFGELMLLMDKQAERARQAAQEGADLRAREAEASHARQLELVREDTKRRERELEQERQRMHIDAKERAERLDREVTAERERQREHTATMLQLVKEQKGPDGTAALLLKGIELARELGGGTGEGGATDPLTALAANLPDILSEAGKIAAIDRSSAAPRPAEANPSPQQRRRPGEPEPVMLEGSVAKAATELIGRLKEQGRDPAAVLAQAFDAIARRKRSAPQRGAAAPAARRTRGLARAKSGKTHATKGPINGAAAKSRDKTKAATP